MSAPHDLRRSVYANSGNRAVLELVDRAAVDVLDVGCGAGDNAALLLARDPHKRIDGITASPAEAARARQYLRDCVVGDIEAELPAALRARDYDAIIYSHVLEHTRDPARVLADSARLLRPGGQCVIAVPNVLHWRQRWEFLRGRFEYQSSGPLDATHLRFFTFDTAQQLLFARAPELSVVHRSVQSSVPLWVLRHRGLGEAARARLDLWGGERWPNLFGAEILLKAVKRR
jgi:SAM-dependent methyltransferase